MIKNCLICKYNNSPLHCEHCEDKDEFSLSDEGKKLIESIQPKGKWVKETVTFAYSGKTDTRYCCSVCKEKAPDMEREPDVHGHDYLLSDFCPHCGADLRDGTKEEKPCPCITCTSADRKNDCPYCKAWAEWSLT